VFSGIMAHSEVEIVPVLDVGIHTCSQSVNPFMGIFPWTRVKWDIGDVHQNII